MKQSDFRALRAALVAAAIALGSAAVPAAAAAQQIPPRPPGMTDEQLRQEIRNRGLGDILRQRFQQSGLTPDQIRSRLRAAGYPEDLVDEYLRPSRPGRDTVPPSPQVLRAAQSLGVADFELEMDTVKMADSTVLTRRDTLFLDSLDFQLGVDSVPLLRDSTGVLRLDTAAVVRFVARQRRPRLFGLDVFRRATNQFSPLATGPVDAGYKLGPGDQLALVLTGAVESTIPLTVTREGFVVIPQVGQLSVANLTLDQLRDLLYRRLGAVYSGVRRGPEATTRFEVTVTRVRAIQVFVTGEVSRPGAYQVSALGTVLNALYQAGGPTEQANFRAVRVMRGSQEAARLDVYDYLLYGNTRSDLRLEQGDVVFVPPLARRVTVVGEVVRKGLYDLAETDDLAALIRMAGGLRPNAFTGRVTIDRIIPPGARTPDGPERVVLSASLDSAAGGGRGFTLAAGDSVTVYRVTRPARNRVAIAGNVGQPGAYGLEPGMRLADLVRAAGGLRSYTYAARAHLVRVLPDSTTRLIQLDLTGLDSPAGTPATNPELMEFDSVTVFAVTGFRPRRTIAVYGAVQDPGTFDFADSMTVRDAVLMAGGLTDDAWLLEAEVSRLPEPGAADTALARVFRVRLDSSYVVDRSAYGRRATNAAAPDQALQPFDNVFIRRVPGWTLQRNVVITGQVRFPGRYTLAQRGERLSDLVARAGGITEEGYAGGAQFFRAAGQRGRVGVDVARVLRDPGTRDDLVLLPGDSVDVPLYQPVVLVEGAVNSPTGVAFAPGHDAGWYVARAGGYSRRSDRRNTYIVQANGAVEQRGEKVRPGARVYVPFMPADARRTDWATLLPPLAALASTLVTLIIVVKR